MSFKRSFFRWICQIFCFCCVSLCSVLYNIFITFFQKTSVNAQPLSPPFFQEIAAHKEIQLFFSFWCLRLRFFYFFIFLLIFGYPLPTPWARFAPFLIDFGAIFGPTFPRLPRWIEAEIKLHMVTAGNITFLFGYKASSKEISRMISCPRVLIKRTRLATNYYCNRFVSVMRTTQQGQIPTAEPGWASCCERYCTNII